MNAPIPPSPKPAPARRMTLSAVTSGVTAQPLRVVIYGPGGIGKSTFGAQAPSAIFLGPEDGSALLDVSRFPQPESWHDVLDAVRELTTAEHNFKTLVIDSADWLEPLCWRAVCVADKAASIEKVGGGYGKGYVAALEEWRKLLVAIEAMRKAKRMHVVVIAHGEVKPYKNPDAETGGDYDRWQLKLHKGAAGLLTEWCDELAFTTFRTFAQKADPGGIDKKRARGVGSERVLYTERRAAFDAKSRHGLPPEMPLSWEEFYQCTQRGAAEVVTNLLAEIMSSLARLEALDTDAAAKARGTLKSTPETAAALSVLLNRINAGVATREAARASASDSTHDTDNTPDAT